MGGGRQIEKNMSQGKETGRDREENPSIQRRESTAFKSATRSPQQHTKISYGPGWTGKKQNGIEKVQGKTPGRK